MFQVILWDIDGTLLNFKMSERYALRKCFSRFHLGDCSDDMIARYSVINTRFWRGLEAGIYTKPQVLQGRFEEFFRSESIPFDRVSEFNDEYQLRLGDEAFFNDNGKELIQKLKGKIRQCAVTNGTTVAQERKLRQSGLDTLLDDIFISEKIGTEKPGIGFFKPVWKVIGDYPKEEILIIGDSLTSDIQGGNNAQIPCCWYNPDKMVNDRNLRIDYEIRNLWEIEKILNIN